MPERLARASWRAKRERERQRIKKKVKVIVRFRLLNLINIIKAGQIFMLANS